jgi:diguanylate cyclase (GGDEF)-like protein
MSTSPENRLERPGTLDGFFEVNGGFASGNPAETIYFTSDGEQLRSLMIDNTQKNSTIEQLQRREAALQRLAYTDELTGLRNRTAFVMDADALLQSRYSDLSGVFIDVNGLKQLNDNHGHHVGDALLKAVANGMTIASSRVRQGFPYRLAGDEFTMLFPMNDSSGKTRAVDSTGERRSSSVDELLPVVGRIARDTLDFVHAADPVFKMASFAIGFTTASKESYTGVEEFLNAMDANMYKAKQICHQPDMSGQSIIMHNGIAYYLPLAA